MDEVWNNAKNGALRHSAGKRPNFVSFASLEDDEGALGDKTHSEVLRSLVRARSMDSSRSTRTAASLQRLNAVGLRVYKAFEAVVFVVILLSLVNMGICKQWQSLPVCGPLEWFYLVVFFLEMIVKIAIFRLDYFTSRMNLLDVVIVMSSIFDLVILPYFAVADGTNLMALRIFRLARLARAAKVLKIKSELFVLASGIAASLRALLWVLVLLFIVIYVFAILFQDVIWMAHGTIYRDIDGEELSYSVASHFFMNMSSSMLTLFSICIGAIWSEVVDPVAAVQPWAVPLFCLFIFLTSFGLLNAIIAIITEQTAEAAAKYQLEEKRLAKVATIHQVEELAQLLEILDRDNDHHLSFDELCSDPRVEEMINAMDVPAGFTLRELFMMLDADCSDTIDAHEFFEGMLKCIESDDFHARCLSELANKKLLVRTALAEERILKAIKTM